MKQALRVIVVIVLVVGAIHSQLLGQGATTGSMRGQVTDTNSDPLIGATITAIHEPSGTTYGTTSDFDGNYNIANMRVGGPYRITVTYLGYSAAIKKDVYIRLGEQQKHDYALEEEGLELEGVEISATRFFPGQESGTATQISEEEIERMPTLNRNLNDYTRLTPQAKETFNGGFSIAGINNRYNAIYIDGAVNNDVFGLASTGTNGGQTGVAPISIDVVDQIQVVLSPYDVTYGGFAGGGINAVTKSGTNEFKGTAYYFLQNQDLVGKTNRTLADRTDGERRKVNEFSQQLYGFSLGGPIVKNKLFFFANVELQDDETPAPFDFGNYEGNSSMSDLQNLRNVLQNEYGYDPGGFTSKASTLESTKLFGKLDWNLNQNHKITLRHQYTKAEETSQFASENDEINFANNGIYFPSTTNSTALEWNSSYGTKFSNNLILGYTRVVDDRDPIGSDFPWVEIEDGDGDIFFGSEEFSTANLLEQDVFTITNNFKWYTGAHTFTFGTHNEFSKFNNVFVRQNFGSYTFSSLDDFLNNRPAIEYARSYSLVDDVSGDDTEAAATFNTLQLGFYAQDEWRPTDRFTLTLGVRLDVPIILDDPNEDTYFNENTVGMIEEFYDLQGARSGMAPEGQLMFSPRLGFNWDMNGDGGTVLRGGAGIFTSRIPFVWPGGMFTNNGLTIGSLDEDDINGDVLFRPDPNDQYTNPNFTIPSGQMDLFVEDFKYPQVFRASLGLDKRLPGGIKASLEGMFTKTINNVFYQNVNSDPTVDFQWTGTPDNRNVYVGQDIDPTYLAVYLGSNTSEGYTYNVTLSLQKKFGFGFDVFAAYTYGDAEAIFEGTSSQNSSQWRGAFNVNGRNSALLGRSDFSLGSRVVAGLSYTQDWNGTGNWNTSISLFYEGESGAPYSYVYNNANNPNNEEGSTSRTRSLIYIPENQGDINLIDIVDDEGNVVNTAAEQWEALNNFIEEDEFLADNRGSYTEKNSNRTPFEHNIDLRFSQDLGFIIGKSRNRLQLTVDIINFTNLLNPDWGVSWDNPFDFRLINFEGYAVDGTTPQYTFTNDDLGDDRYFINDRPSRWRMRLGLRYTFN